MKLVWLPPRRGPVDLLQALGAGAAIPLALARWFPFENVPVGCSIRTLIGIPCPVCGMTRSWVHLVHGRALEALVQSPLGTLLCLGALAVMLYALLDLVWRRPRPFFAITDREAVLILMGFFSALAVNWAYGWWSGTSL